MLAAALSHNRILSTLSCSELDRIQPYLRQVSFPRGAIVHSSSDPTTSVYFPLTGMLCELMVTADGTAVEVASVGNEGMVGISGLLGTRFDPLEIVVQSPTKGLQLNVDVLCQLAIPGTELYRVTQRYMQAKLVEFAQGVLCNRLHSAESRCARWLLTSDDRTSRNSFLITHDFMAYILGMRRATVSVAAQLLQREGFIEYGRGRVRILDRAGLEGASCECYEIIRDAQEAVFA